MKCTLQIIAVGAALVATAAPAAAATLIAPTSVVSFSSAFPGFYEPANTINGSGLSSETPGGLHDIYLGSNAVSGDHWTTNTFDQIGAFITWGFSTPVDLTGAYIWNHWAYSAKTVTLEWFDATDTSLGSLTGISLSNPEALAPFAADFVPFVGESVSSVKLTVNDLHIFQGFAGLAEVRFAQADPVDPIDPVAPIPVPAALPLLASAFGLLAILRRRTNAQ